jgi:3D (Asp-Asp-Asp) domain-containing protein
LRAPSRFLGRATLVVSSLVLLGCLALPATSGADQIGRLRSQHAALASREQAALLQLYARNTGLDRARGRLASVESELRDVRHSRDAVRRQLRVARRTLAIAENRLGAQLRAIYEHSNLDVLGVLFGATTLDDVITGLDSVNRATTSTRDVVANTRAARTRVAHTLRRLDRRTARLARLRAAAAAAEESIAGSKAAKAAYLTGLRTTERLTGQRIADLEQRARAAEAASTVATVQAQAVKSLGAPAAPTPLPAPVQPAVAPGRQLTVSATAYSLHGGTASGLPTGPGVVAVDPTVIPLGTRMFIPGYGPGIAADTGTAIKGLRIDLWFPTLSQAENWGRRTVTITLR